MQSVEFISAAMGLLGALLLATRSRYAGWAFVVWMVSNIGWIVFGTSLNHWGLVVQQLGFAVTSAIGIWKWLIVPSRPPKLLDAGATLTTAKALQVLRLVQYPGYTFKVHGDHRGITYLQATFKAPCNEAGGVSVRQTTRKWRLSRHMTTSELVQTALKCVLTSLEHEAREQFRYRGAAIFGPHFDVERLVSLCDLRERSREVRA
jgi:glucose dehydrogenase